MQTLTEVRALCRPRHRPPPALLQRSTTAEVPAQRKREWRVSMRGLQQEMHEGWSEQHERERDRRWGTSTGPSALRAEPCVSWGAGVGCCPLGCSKLIIERLRSLVSSTRGPPAAQPPTPNRQPPTPNRQPPTPYPTLTPPSLSGRQVQHHHTRTGVAPCQSAMLPGRSLGRGGAWRREAGFRLTGGAPGVPGAGRGVRAGRWRGGQGRVSVRGSAGRDGGGAVARGRVFLQSGLPPYLGCAPAPTPIPLVSPL